MCLSVSVAVAVPGILRQGGRGGGLSNRVAGEDCQTGWQGGTVAHRQWITEGI